MTDRMSSLKTRRSSSTALAPPTPRCRPKARLNPANRDCGIQAKKNTAVDSVSPCCIRPERRDSYIPSMRFGETRTVLSTPTSPDSVGLTVPRQDHVHCSTSVRDTPPQDVRPCRRDHLFIEEELNYVGGYISSVENDFWEQIALGFCRSFFRSKEDRDNFFVLIFRFEFLR